MTRQFTDYTTLIYLWILFEVVWSSFFISLFFQVVHNVGLCIALWDVTKLDDSYIFPGDGASHTIGEWWMEGQAVLWKISSSSTF